MDIVPEVSDLVPTDGSTISPQLQNMSIEFDESIRIVSNEADDFNVTIRGTQPNGDPTNTSLRVAPNRRIGVAGNTASWSLSNPRILRKGTVVTFTFPANGLADAAGTVTEIPGSAPNLLPEVQWTATVANSSPLIITSSPSPGDVAPDLQPVITIVFDEAVAIVGSPPITLRTRPRGSTAAFNDILIRPQADVMPGDIGGYVIDAMNQSRLIITLTGSLPDNSEIRIRTPDAITDPVNVIMGQTSGQTTGRFLTRDAFFTPSVPRFQPAIAPTSPIDGATGVTPGTTSVNLIAGYSRDIATGTQGSVRIGVRQAGSTTAFLELHTIPAADTDLRVVSNDRLRITIPSLLANVEYQVIIEAGLVQGTVLPIANAPSINAGEWLFTTAATPTGGPPSFSALEDPTPANNAPTSDQIRFEFDVPVMKGTGNIRLLTVLPDNTTQPFRTIPVGDNAVQIMRGKEVIIYYNGSAPGGSALDGTLRANTEYQIEIDAGAFVTFSNVQSPAVNVGQYTFTTTNTGDSDAPIIVSAAIPNDGVSDMRYNVNDITASISNSSLRPRVVLTFDENVTRGAGNVTLRIGACGGTNTGITPSLDISDNQVAISFSGDLEYGTQYTLRLNSNSLQDAGSNGILMLCYTFTTRLAPPDFNVTVGLESDTTVVEYSETAPAVTESPFTFQGNATIYNNLRWGLQTGPARADIIDINAAAIGTATAPTYAELTASNPSIDLTDAAVWDSLDVGVYTYSVWQESATQASDTTQLLLVVLKTGIPIIRERPVVGGVFVPEGEAVELNDPIVLTSATTSRFEMTFVYDDNENNISWSSDAVSYNAVLDVVDDRTFALFVPSGVIFGIGQISRTVDVFITLINEATGALYTTPTRTLAISNSAPFDLRFTRVAFPPMPGGAVVPPTVPSVDNSVSSICQSSGSYDLSEFMPPTTYQSYTQASLVVDPRFNSATTSFEKVFSGQRSFVQRPVTALTPGFNPEDTGYGEVDVTAGGVALPTGLTIDDIPWRLNTDNITDDINGEMAVPVTRFALVGIDGVSSAVGIAAVTVYQAPEIEFVNVEDGQEYCRGYADAIVPIDVRIEVQRRGADGGFLGGTSGPGTALQGIFNVFIATTTTGTPPVPAYPAAPISGNVPPTAEFMGEYFYSILEASLLPGVPVPDSIYVRLEYVSHGDEDVGPSSACVGRGDIEFVIYNNPSPPTFNYGPVATTFENADESNRVEVIYCEDATPLEVSVASAESTEEVYTWYELVAGIPEVRAPETFSYTPVPDVLRNVSGDEVRTTEYVVERALYKNEGFVGCASSRASVYVSAVGLPEIEISRVADISGEDADIQLRGGLATTVDIVTSRDVSDNITGRRAVNAGDAGDGVLLSGDLQTCVGQVVREDLAAADRDNFTYRNNYLLIRATNTKVIRSDGVPAFMGDGLFPIDGNDTLALFVPFDAVQAAVVVDRPASISDYVNARVEDVNVLYEWTNVYGRVGGIGGVECRSSTSIPVDVSGLPDVLFSLSDKGRSGDGVLKEACVEEVEFDVNSNTPQGGDGNPRFYIDGIAATVPTGRSSTTFIILM